MDFNIHFGTDELAIEPRKIGFLHWEADVKIGRVVYTFVGWTKTGAFKKAYRYFVDNKGA